MIRSVWWMRAVMVMGLLMAGCSSQAPWVNCEGRLEPINRPAPTAATEPVTEEPAKSAPAAP